MIVEPIRLLVAWLADGVTGLNAQLAGVPRPGGEAAPPQVLLYNELDYPALARNLVPRDALKDGAGAAKPGVFTRFPQMEPEAQVRQPVLPEHLEGGILVPVESYYARRKIALDATLANHAVMLRDARQTMRALVRVVALRFPDAHTTYEQNDCTIGLASSGIQLEGRYLDLGDDELLDSALIPFVVIDRWAIGVT